MTSARSEFLKNKNNHGGFNWTEEDIKNALLIRDYKYLIYELFRKEVSYNYLLLELKMDEMVFAALNSDMITMSRAAEILDISIYEMREKLLNIGSL